MTKKWFVFLATFTIILVLILPSSCGNNTKTPAKTTLPTTSAKPTTTTPATTTTPSTPQVFTTNLYGEPETIDPNKASWAPQLTVLRQCFVGLLGFNADLSIKAVTATEIPTVANGGISADGLTYTFKLRPEVTWSDGVKVVAKDYVYGIKRMLSPEVASEYASFYFDIVGAEEYNASADKDAATQAQLKDAVGVKAVNDTTLQIKLARTRPTFLSLMALWPVYPTREDIITQYGDTWTEPPHYIGNGPFILTEWVHQDHLTFKPNPNYWGTKPKLTQMVFKETEDQNAAFAAYRNNELDMVTPPGGTEKATMADPVLSKEILRYNELTTFGFLFNVSKAPFDNVKLRQAITTAIDRDAFINQVRGGVGTAAYSWIPPGMPGYDAALGAQYKFNAANAKKLLAEAGYADVSKLPEIKYTYSNSGLNPTVAQFLQGQMKDNLGINIILDPMETKAFQAYVNSEQHQWAWTGWGADYPDPDNWLPEYFGTDAGNNHSTYSNAQFDSLAAQAKKELDNTKRLQLWADAQKIIVNDVPISFMFYRERFWLVKPYVKGLTETGMDGQIPGDFFYDQVYIVK
jgi:oligopeptide transport system substrate-binding protein